MARKRIDQKSSNASSVNAQDMNEQQEWSSAAAATTTTTTTTVVTCRSSCISASVGSPASNSSAEDDDHRHDGRDVHHHGHHNGHGHGRVWSKIKEQYRLVEYHALPDYLRDNEYILNHYRADWPLRHTILSIFSVHNETLNIWTHLVGFLFFLALTVFAATEGSSGWGSVSVPQIAKISDGFISYFMPTMSKCASGDNTSQDSSTTAHCLMEAVKHEVVPQLQQGAAKWPFFVFLFGAMTCLLTSSISHLLSCHSRLMSSIMWRMDYAGIATMIATSFFPPIYYVFQCNPVWQFVYLGGITLLGLATVCTTLTPCLTSPKYRIFRVYLFVGMGLSGIIPGGHALLQNWHEPMCLTVLTYELAMVFCYLFGTAIYACRIPERWKPGFFDIAGHSHQIFHIMVIAGAYAHYKAAMVFLEWRNMQPCVAAA